MCSFGIPPQALDDVENLTSFGDLRIDHGSNFITASVAALVESFSFMLLAYIDESDNSYIIKVS